MFASKSDYRAYFAGVQIYVKMSYFLKLANINHSNFSRFMKGYPYDYLIPFDKLERLYQEVKLKIT